MRAVLRKTPVPMIVPTTKAVVALKFRPRTSPRPHKVLASTSKWNGRQQPTSLPSTVFLLRQLHQDRIGPRIQPSQHALEAADTHGRASAGGMARRLPNVHENTRTGARLHRVGVVRDKDAKFVLVIAHAHFLRAFPIR